MWVTVFLFSAPVHSSTTSSYLWNPTSGNSKVSAPFLKLTEIICRNKIKAILNEARCSDRFWNDFGSFWSFFYYFTIKMLQSLMELNFSSKQLLNLDSFIKSFLKTKQTIKNTTAPTWKIMSIIGKRKR